MIFETHLNLRTDFPMRQKTSKCRKKLFSKYVPEIEFYFLGKNHIESRRKLQKSMRFQGKTMSYLSSAAKCLHLHFDGN